MASIPTIGCISFADLELTWAILHLGGGSNLYDNIRGMAVKIILEPNKTKALVIEFPFKKYFSTLPNQSKSF